MSGLRVIDAAALAALSLAASASPRRRRNLNLHASEAEPCNRLLNALEPDSYVPPHRHLDPNKEETFAVVKGRFGVLVFDDAGHVSGQAILAAGGDCTVATIACGTWHTVLALEPGSVFFEAKGGPYLPLQPEERASWAPAEGDTAAPAYLAQLRQRFG